MNTLTLLSDAKYFDEGSSKFAELRSMLDSKHQREKLEAMKRLMAMITIGRDVSSFFPDVVKNIVVESQGQQRGDSGHTEPQCHSLTAAMCALMLLAHR